MVSNTEVVIALGMPDTVHYRSHVNGDRTSKYQELIEPVRDYVALLRTGKIRVQGGLCVIMTIRT